MSQKLPADAFSYYVNLGPERSYDAVATRFKVVTRTVLRTAKREDWAKRLAAIEKAAREKADQATAEAMAEMQIRHQKMLRAMASRAAKALSEYPLTDGMQGIKAADMVIRLERLLAGEPTERTGVTVEEETRKHFALFMTTKQDDWSEDEKVVPADSQTEPAAPETLPPGQEG